MILFLNKDAQMNEIENLRDRLRFMGFESIVEIEENHKVIAIINGIDSSVCIDLFEALPLVEKVAPFNDKFKLVGKGIRKNKSVININGIEIGRDEFIVMAGPCSIESREQIFAIAKEVSQVGATILRGAAFKPRTSP